MLTRAAIVLVPGLFAVSWLLWSGPRPGGDETAAGHVRWRLVGARLDPHRDESGVSIQTLELRVSLRATELMNIDTQITGCSVRRVEAPGVSRRWTRS